MRVRRVIIGLGMILALVGGWSTTPYAAPTAQRGKVALSQAALFSRAARQHGGIDARSFEALTARADARAEQAAALSAAAAPGAAQANQDWNARPQNETTIAIWGSAHWIIGANDYGVGAPIGTGVYTSQKVNYFPPFPLLLNSLGVVEPPVGTGDPALVFGATRAGAGLPAGLPVAYMASIGFSATFCNNGVFVYRSLNIGKSWTRPLVPGFVGGPLRTVVYEDDALGCLTGGSGIFHDKEYITMDNNPGSPFKGRIYVTWTRFDFSGPGNPYNESPIFMAFSDDNGNTWSKPMEVSGASLAICTSQITGKAAECDENQFSYPVVLSNNKVVVHFLNQQGTNGGPPNFRDQILVTVWDPATSTLAGPYKVTELFDGLTDYPISPLNGRQTVCNGGFRLNSAGNIAVGPAGDLYVVWSDNRAHAGEFPFPTLVGGAPPHACPAGKATDTDVFIRKSTDGGMTWTALGAGDVRVNQDALGNDKDQWFPWVAVGPTGTVWVVFYDRRADPGNHLAHTMVAKSTNGGMTWTETTVSDFASNFDTAFFGTASFIGDYNGMAVNPFTGKAYPVWTGNPAGSFDSDVNFDIVGP